MADDAMTADEQLQQLLAGASTNPTVAVALERFAVASALVPRPVLVNTQAIRFATGGNA